MRRFLVGVAAGLMLAGQALVPTTAAAGPAASAGKRAGEQVRILTARAIGYGGAYSNLPNEHPANFAYRPHFKATVEVVCKIGSTAVVNFGPVTSHQGPQSSPFRCTGQPQDVTIFPAAAEGRVRVTASLAYQGAQKASASHARNVTVTDVRAYWARLKAPAQVVRGRSAQLTATTMMLSHGRWVPTAANVTVSHEGRRVGTAKSGKNGQLRFTTPPVTKSGTWALSWFAGGYPWSSSSVEIRVIEPGGSSPAPRVWAGTVTTNTADVHWTAPQGVKVTGYRFGWTSSNGKPVPSWQGDWPANRTSPLTMTNLQPDTTYDMWVAAITPQGLTRRGTVTVTTLPDRSPQADAPGIRIGTVTRTTADVHWTAPNNVSNIVGYRFGWSTPSGKPVPEWQGDWPATAPNPLRMINLHPGATYRMWVAAITPSGVGKRATIAVTTRP